MKITNNVTQIAMVTLLSLSVQAKKLLVDVPLAWKPTTELTGFQHLSYAAVSAATIKIAPLKDDRKVEPAKRIGENKEDAKEFLPVETQADIATWVTEHMVDVFKEVGLKISNEKPDYVLVGELKDYFVTETNTYAGVVRIHFALKKGDKVVWEHDMIGRNSRFGRSYKYDNYMESLSDSLIDTCFQLLDNDEFKSAFQTKKEKN